MRTATRSSCRLTPSNDRQDRAHPPLAQLRHRAAAHATGGGAFPSWFLRITCDRCGKDRMLNEVHMSAPQRGMVLGVLIGRMRHDGCGGRAGRVELLTGIDGVSSRPVRKIVLLAG
jgi:hypothetical protein